MTITDRLFLLLKERGKSQRELAAYLKTGSSTVSGWREDNRNPSLNMVVPICEFLGVSPLYLLTGEEDKTDPEIEEIIGMWRRLDRHSQVIIKGEIFRRVEALEKAPEIAPPEVGKTLRKAT